MEIEYVVICLPKNRSHYLVTNLFKLFLFDCKVKKGSFIENLDDIPTSSKVIVYNSSLLKKHFPENRITIYDFRDYLWCRLNTVPDNLKLWDRYELKIFQNFYNNGGDFISLIPKTKLQKILDKFCLDFLNTIDSTVEPFDNFYRLFMRHSFAEIEKGFIKCETDIVRKFYPKANTCGWLPTKYNLHTTTGRPSCAYGGINFLALNKESGVRRGIISRFDSGMLMDFDFDAYDLRIIAKFLLNDPFPEDINVHEYLASQILGKSSISPEEYRSEKLSSFWYLFGDSKKDILKLPEFYKKVMELRRDLYLQFNSKGYVLTFCAKRPMMKMFLGDLTEPTLFNYYVQAFETEISAMYIRKALEVLKDMESKLILYTYDSLLIDTHPEEKKEIINKFKYTIPKHRLKIGSNYGDMVSI